MNNINLDDCWLFAGYIAPSGYGLIKTGKTYRKAHRIMYEHEMGGLPANLVCDHLCRVKQCINPAHIEPVTNKENILRGEGITAVNAQKSHCSNGHEFNSCNTMVKLIKGSLTRICRTCRYDMQRQRYQRVKHDKPVISGTKHCKFCGQDKPVAEFNKHPLTKDRLNSKCKACLTAYNKTYRATYI